MDIHLPFLLLALVLLWLPRSWLRRGRTLWRRRRRHLTSPSWTHAPADGTTLTFRLEFAKPRNYLDFFRAAAGTMALVGSNGITPAVGVLPDAAGAQHQVLLVHIVILLIGVLAQTLRREHRRLSLAAPIFYVAGLTLGLAVPIAALSAFMVAWALVPVVPYTQGFLIVQAIVFGAIGTFLGGVNLLTLAGVAVGLVPVLLSLLSRRPLLIYSRRPAGVRSS